MVNGFIRFFLKNPLVTALLVLGMLIWGAATAPFGWHLGGLPSDPVPVDAIPDIGENQQIVVTEWPGRSPQDVEDQVTYPLTTSLLGIPGVRTVRSSSMFGLSSIYIIFDEGVEFYWSRSRVLEKLNALPAGLLPEDVSPALGPDATALGQVFWYTIEGRDSSGATTGGWDLNELRTIQDFQVRYALNAVPGVSEVASIGGFVQEYQVDVDPDALKVYGIGLMQVADAVKHANLDVGARTLEINQAEYLVRGSGYLHSLDDLRNSVVGAHDGVPVRVRDVARVTLGPAPRRGVLDKEGAEVVGGVVVARYGSNPLAVIDQAKARIAEIAPGLPTRVLPDGRTSRLTIVPFYDRTRLIHETLGTLEEALSLEVLITILVVVVMLLDLRSSLVIAALLPLAVLMVFVAMRYTGVEANIVALSGIVIAIGTMVDLGIVLSENIVRHKREAGPDVPIGEVVYTAAVEVAPAIITSVSTTIVGFIPVFALQAAEGKLFHPLAFTKTYALVAALLVALVVLPTLARLVFRDRVFKGRHRWIMRALMGAAALTIALKLDLSVGLALGLYVLASLAAPRLARWWSPARHLPLAVVIITALFLLTHLWLPLGADRSLFTNMFFVGILVGVVLGGLLLLQWRYRLILAWCLAHKRTFLSIPLLLILIGLFIWQGADRMLAPIDRAFATIGVDLRNTGAQRALVGVFPGIGKEFMPALDEGSFLLMPTSMPHAGVSENVRVLKQLDQRVAAIPEVEMVVGKAGRTTSALDPAPISMYENIINYRPEYEVDGKGHRLRFLTDDDGRYITRTGDTLSHADALTRGLHAQDLVPDADGEYYRNWRDDVRTPDDIWAHIAGAAELPGVTSAPQLQPIETRLVMLQTGMRAPMGIKVQGGDLQTIEAFGRRLETILKTVPSVRAEAVFADRIVGKPYLELAIRRDAIARYGLTVADVQHTIDIAIGGMPLTTTVEGRERFDVRVRYPRELRDRPERIAKVLVTTKTGTQIPLGELVDLRYARGPQVIKSEDTFLVGYVLFDKRDGHAEVDVVQDAQRAIQARIDDGSLQVPAGVSYRFSGSYENEVRAERRLALILPVVLLLVFLILYFQFRSISTALMVFSGVAMAFTGGFLLLWAYGQPWFLHVHLFGTDLRDLFAMHTVNLSVAVWVGFIALFGIATDDGVLIATYIDQRMAAERPRTIAGVRHAVMEAGARRVRPAVMTIATTVIALLPVLTSTGRGSDIMVPMAIPAFGGMLVAAITIFITPVLYCWREERKLRDRS
ncbi:MAG: efflux RND transporter permease subunit [Flavobacteriales bacterium]|nr:efflux RND transporter permease subunit [Flavobacteriales bacterium]